MSLSRISDSEDMPGRSIAPPAFDCLYKWLGIPRSEQPPHYYRLLGIPRYTCDPEVIENAAEQRQMFLLTLQRGEHAAEAQRLFDDVEAAKKCLLNESTRECYDRELTVGSAELQSSGRTEDELAVSFLADDIESSTVPIVRGRFERPQPSRVLPLIHVVGTAVSGVIGLVLGYLLITTIDRRYDFLKLYPKASPAVVAEVNESEAEPPAELPPRELSPRLPSVHEVPELSPGEELRRLAEQHLAESIQRGDLVAMLSAAEALAKLEQENPFRAKLRLLESSAIDVRITSASSTAAMATVLEEAVAAKEFAVAAAHVDRLLLAARQLNDRDLQRRATLLALKVRQTPE